MKIGYTIFFFIISLSVFSQFDTTYITHDNDYIDDTVIYITDTVIGKTSFGRPILIGTTVLPETINTMGARAFGFFLEKVESSPCKRSRGNEAYITDDEVFSIQKTDSTWTCDLKINANCCHDFLCEISIENDTTLNFIYKGYGAAYCACKCCFGIQYEIKLDDLSKDEVTKINKKRN